MEQPHLICRRGGVEKQDIGAIRVLDTTTEFEISGAAAESFAAMIRRPDKEDNIRIEAMDGAPQGQGAHEKRSYPPRREAGAIENLGGLDDLGRSHRGSEIVTLQQRVDRLHWAGRRRWAGRCWRGARGTL